MNKIIAVYLGPSGLAMIGQFQNFASIVSSISNASTQTGLLTQTANYNNDVEAQEKVWFNALLINIAFSILISLFVLLFSNWLSQEILFNETYSYLFLVLGISIMFYALNLFFLSIVNGLGNIKLYTIINIFISIFSLILVSLLTIFYKLEGSIMGLILTQSVVFFISYLLIYKNYKNSFFKFDLRLIDVKILKVLLSYGLVTFLTGLITSLAFILIRTHIVTEQSIFEAGLWEGALKIGVYFNLLFSLPISIYLLPKFSETKNTSTIVSLIKQSIIFIIPIMILVSFIFLMFKDFFISVLFDCSFLEIRSFVSLIIFAEFFRVITNIFINLLMAKKRLLINVIFEFVSYSLFVISVYIFFNDYGLYGISFIYCIISAVMFIIYFIHIKKRVLI